LTVLRNHLAHRLERVTVEVALYATSVVHHAIYRFVFIASATHLRGSAIFPKIAREDWPILSRIHHDLDVSRIVNVE
jgi:hypothetical protein